MRRINRIPAVMLVLALVLGVLAGAAAGETRSAYAAAKPKFTLEAAENGTAIKVTIQPMKDAELFNIYMRAEGEKEFNVLWDYQVKEDGTKTRTQTIKGLSAGKYIIQLQAYASLFGFGIFSGTSEPKSIELVPSESPMEEYKKAKTGDVIKFGAYYQDWHQQAGKKEIEWIVLSNDGNELFVLSKYGLDNRAYHDDIVDMTWAKCSLRKWLNKEFYNEAFSDSDKKLIKTVTLKNNDNPVYGEENDSRGGKDTKDKVFLLSIDEVTNPAYGFSSSYDDTDVARRCAVTEYTRAGGAETRESQDDKWKEFATADGEPTSRWLLRSPGYAPQSVAYVLDDGIVDLGGDIVGPGRSVVRPALVIDLNP